MKEIIRTMCSYSETMPEVPFKIILREQYLNLFDQQFDEHKILAVKGQDGVGVLHGAEHVVGGVDRDGIVCATTC